MMPLRYWEQLLVRSIWTPKILGYACGCTKVQHQAASGKSLTARQALYLHIYSLRSGLESLNGRP